MKTDRLKIIFLLCSLWLVFPCFCLAAKGKDFVVVIDPGHGGHDPGAIGRRGKEKNINLNVALKVGQLIQNNCNDVKVIYTRKTDVFIPLDRRAQIANNAKADLFISIHTNSIARGRTVRGAETYTLGLHRTEENLEVAKKENSVILIEDNYEQRYAGFNPNSSESYIIFEFVQDKNMEKSVKLATLIQKQFKNTAKRIDKGVLDHRLQVVFGVFGVGGLFGIFGIVDWMVEPATHIPYLADRHYDDLRGSRYLLRMSI